MVKARYLLAGLSSAAVIAAGSIGVASAATNHNNVNVGSSGIPKTVFKQEKLDASAQVLNTTTSDVQAAHKNKTFKTLLSNAGLTKQTYEQKLQAQLTTDLEGLGYTQTQVNTALQKHPLTHTHHGKKSQV